MSETDEQKQLREANEFTDKLAELARTSPTKVALLVEHNGMREVSLFPNRQMRLRSVYKMAIALAYARKVAEDSSFASQTASVSEVTKCNPEHYDGGAHQKWLGKHAGEKQVTLQAVAEGMMQESSNACTQYMMNAVGVDTINQLLKELKLHSTEYDSKYDELEHPLRGSANDMLLLLHTIENKAEENSKIKEVFKSIVDPLPLESVYNGMAEGYVKNGIGIGLTQIKY